MLTGPVGHVSIVKYLLKTGRVDINRAGAPNGDTALHFACHGGHIGVVKVLLEDSKLDVNALRAGSTALADSCFDGNHTVATLLLSDPRTYTSAYISHFNAC
jgi:ankyrin repeat protein